MNDELKATVYVNGPLWVDAIKVPGGILYITSHQTWQELNTTFVPSTADRDESKAGTHNPNPQYVKEFLEGKR